MATIKQNPNHHASGSQAVTTTAKSIVQIASSTGPTTTYTATTVVDSTAWDLSNVEAGDAITTLSGYRAIIKTVDDANDTLTIEGGWMPPSGRGPDANVSSILPADGIVAFVDRVNRCKRIHLTADAGNTNTIYIRRGGSRPGAGVYTDYPLVPGASLTIEADEEEYLDLTTVWVIAAGTETLDWIIGGAGAGGDIAVTINQTGTIVVSWSAFADGDVTPDVSSGSFFETANTGATSITHFDTTADQIIWVFINDVNTSIIHDATKINLQGGLDYGGPSVVGDILKFVRRSGVWYQTKLT